MTVAGVRRSHVIDPTTGHPVDHLASVSTIATDAATADVNATAAGTLPVDAALAYATAWGAGCLCIAHDGTTHSNAAWRAAATCPPTDLMRRTARP